MQNEYYNNNLDIALSDDGDLVFHITEDNQYEISLVKGSEQVIQGVEVRLKTNLMELFLHENFGNRLLDIIGKRNTRETADLGRRFLMDTILRENRIIDPAHLKISATPLDASKLMYIIKIADSPFSSVDIMLEVDLEHGIRRVV